jgi:thiamine transport system substrate-binding protein
MFKLTFAAGLLSTSMALAQIPTLTVYAPDYFTSEWGPGPSIESKFEETCNCDLVFSAGELLPRLVLEGQNTRADIVIGLNTDITKKARELGIFSPHKQDNNRLKASY